ncbi:MAG TPA: ribonuclease HI [Anaerolineales bacterium]|nr:ribonuclease HI [Anaerolineales bacterium]
MADLRQVTIYTDGACEPNPGPGGWAALLIYGKHERELCGAEVDTTNNRMELTAAVQALEALKEPCQVDYYTDSEYLRRGITEWLPDWRKRGWKRKSGKLRNIDLWQMLESGLQEHTITWHWVRGHAGNRLNQRVDSLARKAMRQIP